MPKPVLTPFTLLALWMVATPLVAQSSAKGIVPFEEFRNSIGGADFAVSLNARDARVTDRAAFEEMRQHLLGLYSGMEVRQSLLLEGDVFDCIPIEQQPSVRLGGIVRIAEPPVLPAAGPAAWNKGSIPQATQALEGQPILGKSAECEDGTIPMRRVTLEEMTRFPSLRAYLSKSPDESAPETIPSEDPCTGNCPHKYSYTLQSVANHGGNSALAVWSPPVDTTIGEIFSLSQEWYVGGTGDATQTVETGWQNYPALYGDNRSRLFIFYTPDNYKTGCYNLTCKAFVQTSKTVFLGGAFNAYSAPGGPAREFEIAAYLSGGNWWLFHNNVAFGYYPGSLYNKGAMATGSSLIEYGSESTQSGGTWPPQGSGAWSNTGYGKAAYQRSLYYYDNTNTSVWDTLKPQQPSPNCYTITGPKYGTGNGWGIYFFEGGPGGANC